MHSGFCGFCVVFCFAPKEKGQKEKKKQLYTCCLIYFFLEKKQNIKPSLYNYTKCLIA